MRSRRNQCYFADPNNKIFSERKVGAWKFQEQKERKKGKLINENY
jgi:hypothetical protein